MCNLLHSRSRLLLQQHADLDKSQLERKIRLLSLASLGFKHVGHDLSYTKVADALQVDVEEVEKWAIDGESRLSGSVFILTHLIPVIRAGLLWAKLSQTTQSLHVTRATARTLEREQWEALEKRLVGWKSGLAGVLEVVANARTQGGHGQSANVA